MAKSTTPNKPTGKGSTVGGQTIDERDFKMPPYNPPKKQSPAKKGK